MSTEINDCKSFSDLLKLYKPMQKFKDHSLLYFISPFNFELDCQVCNTQYGIEFINVADEDKERLQNKLNSISIHEVNLERLYSKISVKTKLFGLDNNILAKLEDGMKYRFRLNILGLNVRPDKVAKPIIRVYNAVLLK